MCTKCMERRVSCCSFNLCQEMLYWLPSVSLYLSRQPKPMFCNVRFLKLSEWGCECPNKLKRKCSRSTSYSFSSMQMLHVNSSWSQLRATVAFCWASDGYNKAAKKRTRIGRKWKRKNSFSCWNILDLSSPAKDKNCSVWCNIWSGALDLCLPAAIVWTEYWVGRKSFTFTSLKRKLTWLSEINN